MNIEPKQREILAQLADVLIPAGDGFPSASQADVAGEHLDAVLEVRPDLADGLSKLLQMADGRNPQGFINELQVQDAEAYGILSELVPGAYFLNEQVQARLKYDGQSPRPFEPHPDYLEDGLLQSVVDRGAVYRPTPNKESPHSEND